MAHESGGLRERKKQQTREAIVRHALALFSARGYDATTIADIAAAADISPRTFFGYFASKEAVVFHDVDEVLAGFGERLRDRRAGESAFEALRAWILERFEDVGLSSEDERTRRRLIASTPALQAHDHANIHRFAEALADAVAADLGVPAGSLRPQLVSAAAMAALGALRQFHDDAAPVDVCHAAEVMDEAIVFLQGGLEALRRHPYVRRP